MIKKQSHLRMLVPKPFIIRLLLIILFCISHLAFAQSNPEITQEPTGQTVIEGEPVEFVVQATGDNLAYQWFFDGNPINNDSRISGATTSRLAIQSAHLNDEGDYRVVVSITGSPDLKATSDPAFLKVNPIGPASPQITLQPTSQTVETGQTVELLVQATGTSLVYQWVCEGNAVTNGGRLSGATANRLIIQNAQTNDSGNYWVVVTVEGSPDLKATSDEALLKVNLTPTGPPQITQQPSNQTKTVGQTATFSVQTQGSDVNFQWRFNGTDIFSETDAGLVLTDVRPKDAGSYSVLVSNGAGSIVSSNAILTVLCGFSIFPEIVSLSVAGGSGSVSITADDDCAWTVIQTNSWITITSSTEGSGNGTINFLVATNSSTASRTGVLTIGGRTFTIVQAALILPVAIVAQPQSQSVVAGNGVSFMLTATGTAPLNYRWRKNGVAISGATTSSYSISNVQTNHAGSYSVIVTNAAGSLTSSNAVLTVLVRPLITAQPQSRTPIAGSNVTFSVVAKGTIPLKYQWRFKGTNLSGATKSTYSITNVQPRRAGNYSVIVSNLAGSVTSSNAVLTVKLLLTASAVGNGSVSPTNVLVNPGSTQSFKAIAFTNYTVGEWYLGGVRKQTGGTNYTLYNIQTNHAVKVVFRPIIKLYWQNTNGLNSEWRFNGTNYLTSASLPSINPAWQMVGQSDFNSDNSMDLLFQNTDGRLLLRTMRGTSLIRENLVRNGQAAPVGWKLKGLSDLNSDVQTDFLFQTSTNRLTTWFMSKGTNFLSSTLMQSHSSGWRVAGMADFNADKKNDILWQNSAGHVSVWFMNGRTNTAKVNLRDGKAAAPGWNISALADMDFNGQKDILLQNSKGQVAVWLMNRTNYLGTVLLRNGQTNAPGWQLKGPK